MAHLEVVYLDALSHLRVLRIPQALPLRTRMLTILGAVNVHCIKVTPQRLVHACGIKPAYAIHFVNALFVTLPHSRPWVISFARFRLFFSYSFVRDNERPSDVCTRRCVRKYAPPFSGGRNLIVLATQTMAGPTSCSTLKACPRNFFLSANTPPPNTLRAPASSRGTSRPALKNGYRARSVQYTTLVLPVWSADTEPVGLARRKAG